MSFQKSEVTDLRGALAGTFKVIAIESRPVMALPVATLELGLMFSRDTRVQVVWPV